MFEDFDARTNQKPDDDDEDSETSYSYPSYSRFTYTGKTKSRLGRSRFMRQTGNKEETKKSDVNMSGTSDLKSNPPFLQSNSQAPKTPGVSWLQRGSSLSQPFTPGENSRKVYQSFSEMNSFPIQANFLLNLNNDTVQNSNCKRNLPFTTTPFKSKGMENQGNSNPLRELNQLVKPENPFSKLDFFSRSKKEKENNGHPKNENEKKHDFDPKWNQLKNICDSAICPVLPDGNPEGNKDLDTVNQSNLGKTSESVRTNLFAPFNATERKDDKKREDDSSNTPLDLSSAESTSSRMLFSKSLISGSDHFDSDTSGCLNRQLKDTSTESSRKSDDSTAQKTNTDALSGFLPQFLVPKNKSHPSESPGDDDVSANSVATVVESLSDFQPQTFPKPQMPSQTFIKPQVTSDASCNIGNEVNSSSQYRPAPHNEVIKLSPPSLPINFACKEPSPPLLINRNDKIQGEIHHSTVKKSSPTSVPDSNIYLELPKSSPSSHGISDSRNLVNDGQNFRNQDQKHTVKSLVTSIGHSTINDKEINTLAQNIDMKLSKAYGNDPIVNHLRADKNPGEIKNVNFSVVSSNEICSANQFKSVTKSAENINPLASIQQKPPVNNQIQRDSEPLNGTYQSNIQPHVTLPAPLESREKNVNQVSLKQAIIPTQAVVEQKNPAMYSKPSGIQSSYVNQKTFLAPQQPLDRLSSTDFPHAKPEIPQLPSSKQSFPAVKKPTQFKPSVPRGMPSRTDTELSVNGKSYTILSILGKGGSSEVYQVLEPGISKLLAVKCVDLSMVDKTIADGYLNEIDLLSRLQGCASVIRMFDYEYVQECKMLYVVMEKGDTDLSHLIRDISKTKKISMSMIIYYWTEMLQAVKDIHDQGIIHSDLKPANFLLVSGRLKLIDFGIASSQGDMTSVVKEVTTGTWNYMSPEAIKHSNASCKGFKITYKSDVWSLGCILYNLVYGKTPFSHITNTWGKLTAIADPNHCIEFPEVGAPAVLVKALRSCFHREPKLRPTVAELLRLPYHSTGDSGELSSVGRQVQAILPSQWWHKVAHLFPEVKSN